MAVKDRRAQLLKLTFSEVVDIAWRMDLAVPTDYTKRNIISMILKAEGKANR